MTTLEKLRKATSLTDVSTLLGYSPAGLSYILYKYPGDKKYTKFSIPKGGGDDREIWAPCPPLKLLQRRLANVLYACRDSVDARNDLKPLSHGFRRKQSIITNAKCHRKRRYVLNCDLKDFFPSINFGRVRGFFISNKHFKLDQSVATIVAQIACHENILPQGSPCSPIIADLIGHYLDVRLVQLAKKHRLTYSRYADDLTLSTSQREFPEAVAMPILPNANAWTLGDEVAEAVAAAGFRLNAAKTRIQYRNSRQVVTGLIVNTKVNVRSEYYRSTRLMCHSLFLRGTYHFPLTHSPKQPRDAEAHPAPESIAALGPIEGRLSHIFHVKDSSENGTTEADKRTAAYRRLYARFLAYKYFVRLERPLIVCEGKTDNIYLRYAIRGLDTFHPQLGAWDGESFKLAITFFNYGNRAHRILGVTGGTSGLKYFLIRNFFKKDIDGFRHKPMKHPVIVLIDNDKGANKIFNLLSKEYDKIVNLKSDQDFYHITDNLYLVKTPEQGESGISCIEDFFDPGLLATKLKNKTFNPHKEHDADGEYGKYVFAEKVVRPKADQIDFSGFAPLLKRIAAVIDHYAPPA